MTTKKLSFAESRAEIQAAKNNSDLSNLAHALEYVEQARQELNALEKEITEAAEAVEKGTILSVDTVLKLYRRAQGESRL